jgi:hypothetical protein
MESSRVSLRRFVLIGIVCVIALYRRIRAAVVRDRSIPFSPLVAKGYVGSEYLDRHDIDTTEEMIGEVDDFSVFARPDFDPDRVHPAVRRFYERTTEYQLTYNVVWHRGFRIGAALVSPLTRWIEQLNLPGKPESRELRSRIVGLASQADPRRDARAWIRVDPSSREAVFVAIYAHHQRDGITYTNIAVPLPWANLSTVLYVDALNRETDNGGATLTTNIGDDSGLYLVTPLCVIKLPMEQRFRVWPADTSDPDAPDIQNTTENTSTQPTGIVAVHEMWLYDRKFLTIQYRGGIDPDATKAGRQYS